MVLCQDILSVLSNIFKGFTHVVCQWGGCYAQGSISFESQGEHSPIDDVSFCGLQQYSCLCVGCQFFVCATMPKLY